MSSSVLKDKTYAFAVVIVKTCRAIVTEQKEYVLSKQLLRSGTAIGALIAEAAFAQSKADFVSKLSISLKEAHETQYWVSLLKDTDLIDETTYNSLYKQLDEILRMLVASIKTAKGIEKKE